MNGEGYRHAKPGAGQLVADQQPQRLKLEPESVLVADLFSETMQQMDPLAQTAGVTLAMQATHEHVSADRIRLRQVLLILLDNALRFTASGGSINLTAKTSAKQVLIEVSDTGKGIAAEHLPHLFDRFYQVPSSENEASRSNGLGLAIARALIEAQGGSIQITSQPGHGTRVSISIPAAQVG